VSVDTQIFPLGDNFEKFDKFFERASSFNFGSIVDTSTLIFLVVFEQFYVVLSLCFH